MPDDLVKRLNTPWDTDRSIISQTDKWMRERKEAAERIEELEAELAKAVALAEEALEFNSDGDDYIEWSSIWERIAALKGEANG